MAGTTTTYDVVTRYSIDTRGSGQGLMAMEKQMHSVASANDIVLRGLKAMVGLMGAHEFKKHFLDINSEMEQAKLTTAGFLEMGGLGKFKENMQAADDLVKQYTIDARSSIATTKDFVEMSKGMTAGVVQAGGSIKDLHDISVGLVVAGKATGRGADYVALEAQEALMGMVNNRQVFNKIIMQSIGYVGEEGRAKWKALDAHTRLVELKRALEAPWLKSLQSAQEHSMEGAKSTFIDNAQLAAMRAGKSLFEGIKVELNQWNEYLIKNGETIDHIADVVGGKLLQAAISFKNAIMWAAEHWKTIAASYAAMKAAGYLASGAGGLVGSAATAAGGLPGVVGSTFGTKVASISLAAAAVYIGGTELASWIDRKQSEDINRAGGVNEGMMSLFGANDRDKASALRQMLVSQGLAGEGGLNKKAFADAVNADQFQRIKWAKTLGIGDAHEATPEMIAERMAKAFADIMREDAERRSLNTDDIGGFYGDQRKYEVKKNELEKPKVNINIQRIEVTTEDPDVFAFEMVDALRDAAMNPSSSLHALREG
jgi:hypothetical protein